MRRCQEPIDNSIVLSPIEPISYSDKICRMALCLELVEGCFENYEKQNEGILYFLDRSVNFVVGKMQFLKD